MNFAFTYYLFVLFFIALVLYFFLNIFLFFFNKLVFFFISLFLMMYFLITTFTYLYKSLSFSRLNSINARFWKRSFYLFWMLELFLFFIYSYLLFNSSTEFWVMDLPLLNHYGVNFNQTFLLNLVIWLGFLNLSAYTLLSINVNNSKILFFLLTLLFLYFFNKEIYPLYYVNSFYYNYTFLNDVFDDSWNLESIAYYSRPVSQYMYIILILKFWHIIFINIFFLFYLNASNKSNYTISTNNMSFVYQNILFLFLFFLLNLGFLIKFYVLFLFKFFYAEVFLQNNVIIFNTFISNFIPNFSGFNVFNFLVFFI